MAAETARARSRSRSRGLPCVAFERAFELLKTYVDIKVAYRPLRPLFASAVLSQDLVLFHKDCIEGLLRPGERGYWSRAASAIKAYEMLCGAGRLTNANPNARGYGEFKRFPIFKRNASIPLARELDRLVGRSDCPTWEYLERMRAYHNSISGEGCLQIEGSARMSWCQVEEINSGLGLENDLTAIEPWGWA